MVRLPLAAVLGAALALRPKRRGTPPRQRAGRSRRRSSSPSSARSSCWSSAASLARAFGIVGAANLVRYRSKIEDPKDAVVMLCALAVGLACGVGLYALASSRRSSWCAALWVIESFEPESKKLFDLTDQDGRRDRRARPKIRDDPEADSSWSSPCGPSSDEEVSYEMRRADRNETRPHHQRHPQARSRRACLGRVGREEEPKTNRETDHPARRRRHADCCAPSSNAKKTIDIVIFRFDRPEVEKALEAAVDRGVAVRALIAHTNQGGEKTPPQAGDPAARRRASRWPGPPTTCRAITAR